MKPFAWILLTFPVYLLVNGKLLTYVKFAATKAQQK